MYLFWSFSLKEEIRGHYLSIYFFPYLTTLVAFEEMVQKIKLIFELMRHGEICSL